MYRGYAPLVTNQPISGWDLNPIPEDLMGLESLDQLRQLTIKQRHPGFLERNQFNITF